jgi:hypothetical protein
MKDTEDDLKYVIQTIAEIAVEKIDDVAGAPSLILRRLERIWPGRGLY